MKKFMCALALSVTVLGNSAFAFENSGEMSAGIVAPQLSPNFVLFSTSSTQKLAGDIAQELNITLGDATVGRFNDGENNIQLNVNVRNKDVYIVGSTCRSPNGSVNDHLMEVLLMADAARRASAKTITAVIPYYGYARQDRKSDGRQPISARAVATMIEVMGVKRVINMDLHCGQIQGFFDCPVDNLPGWKIFADYIKGMNLKDLVIVSPDAGGNDRVKKLRKRLKFLGVETDTATIDKDREMPGVVGSMTLKGDVSGKDAIILDDICDTGGTLVKAAETLVQNGAKSVYACVTHGVMSNDALDKIAKSKFNQVIITDSIPLQGQVPDNLKVISIAPLMAKTIKRIQNDQSISEMLKDIN